MLAKKLKVPLALLLTIVMLLGLVSTAAFAHQKAGPIQVCMSEGVEARLDEINTGLSIPWIHVDNNLSPKGYYEMGLNGWNDNTYGATEDDITGVTMGGTLTDGKMYFPMDGDNGEFAQVEVSYKGDTMYLYCQLVSERDGSVEPTPDPIPDTDDVLDALKRAGVKVEIDCECVDSDDDDRDIDCPICWKNHNHKNHGEYRFDLDQIEVLSCEPTHGDSQYRVKVLVYLKDYIAAYNEKAGTPHGPEEYLEDKYEGKPVLDDWRTYTYPQGHDLDVWDTEEFTLVQKDGKWCVRDCDDDDDFDFDVLCDDHEDTLTVTKTFQGISDLPDSFSIEIQRDGKTVETLNKTNGSRDGNVYTWTVPLAAGEYWVEEKGYEVDGYTVTPQLDEVEGRTKSVIDMPDYDISVKFLNTYTEGEVPPVEHAKMTITKTFHGINGLPDTFHIEIVAKDGTVVETLNKDEGQQNNNVYTWTVPLAEGEYTVEEKGYAVDGFTVVPKLDEVEGRTKSVIDMPDHDISVKFVNTYTEEEVPSVEPAEMTITKTFYGINGLPDTFHIEIVDKDGTVVKTLNKDNGQRNNNVYTWTVGLTEGQYTVEEKGYAVDGFTVVPKLDEVEGRTKSVIDMPDHDISVKFVNTYTEEEVPPVEHAKMTVTKTFYGINGLPDTFHIEIVDKDGTVVKTLNKDNGQRNNNVYTWTVELAKGEYTVEEKGYALDGFTVMPKLDEVEGRTKSVINMPDHDISVKFVNTYEEIEQPPVEHAKMTVTKTFYGINGLPDSFHIEIQKDGAVVKTLNKDNGQRNNNVYTWTVELPEGEYTVEEKGYAVDGFTVMPKLDEEEGRTKSVIAMPDYDINVRFVNTYKENEQPPVKAPVLEIDKTADVAGITVGGNVIYTITVKNTGNADATNVTITDTLPAGMTYVSSTENGSHANGVITWTIGTLKAGESKTVTVTATANSTGDLVNTAAVDSNELEPKTDDATVSVTSGGGGGGETTRYYKVTVNYLNADGKKIADSFVSNNIREGGSWNFSDKQLETITVGDVTYTFSHADGAALTGDNIRSNQTVNLYYESDTDIDDGDTPLDPGPGGETGGNTGNNGGEGGDGGEIDIDDGETPLNPGPGGDGDTTNIEDGETPLAGLPQTGAAQAEINPAAVAGILFLAILMTAAGAAYVVRSKKHHN